MTYTFTQETSYDLIPDGEYEATIEKVNLASTKNGKEKIAIMYRLRSDIEQGQQNRVVFEDIWKERDADFYNRKRLNQLLGTQHFQTGTEFNSIDDVMDALKGVNLILVIRTEHDSYRDEDVNKVAYYKSTEHKPQSLSSKPVVEVSEDDLPF